MSTVLEFGTVAVAFTRSLKSLTRRKEFDEEMEKRGGRREVRKYSYS